MKKHLGVSALAFIMLVVQAAVPLTAAAKAHIAVVFVFKSTPQLHSRAVAKTRSVANAISMQSGWDSRIISKPSSDYADAAANVGAEVYIVGQVVEDRVMMTSFRTSTGERIYSIQDTVGANNSTAYANLTGGGSVTSAPAGSPHAGTVDIPSGDLLSVMLTSDIGSRISQEGDTFAVLTVADYYSKGKLILPKGSPGYGIISHLKRAGSFHAGGELNFTVKRLILPSGKDFPVETNGATSDADKTTEHNGNEFGQYLLWGVGMFAKRGNDILIKKGATFHVSTLESINVPVSPEGASPARLDETLISSHG